MSRTTLILILAMTISHLALGRVKEQKAASSGRAEQELIKLDNELTGATIRGDVAALDRILAENLIYTHSSGRVETKAQFLAGLKSGEVKYESINRDDVKVQVLGEAAVLTGHAVVRLNSKGQVMNLNLRFMRVYAKQQGRWQAVAYQSTHIAQ